MKNWMPHGHCFLWDPWVLWPMVIGQLLTWFAYMLIPYLIYLAARRLGVQIPAAADFVAFILACGLGHLLAVVNLWHAQYALEAGWNLLTAGISMRAAWRIYRAFLATDQLQQAQIQELVTSAEALLEELREVEP